jgi:hypothetical protein
LDMARQREERETHRDDAKGAKSRGNQ